MSDAEKCEADAALAREAALEEQYDDAERVRQRWAVETFSVDELRQRPERWARSCVEKADRLNAGRELKQAPDLTVPGDQLLTHVLRFGGRATELAKLTPLTNDQVRDLRIKAAAQRDAEGMAVRDRAKALHAGDAAVAPPSPVVLTELLAQPDEAARWRINDAWPSGGRVLFTAAYKSGKSTAVSNVIRTLVDGGQFLGRFDVAPVRRVALIDTELNEATLRRWYRDAAIRNTDAVTLIALRGKVSSFDITNPTTRTWWAQQLVGADVVILDCLRPVLDGLGLSEHTDAGRLLVAFDALLAEIGADEAMIVHHHGHANERARGDSRLLDWPDAIWRIVRGGDDADDDGTRPRFFTAMGRDVAVPEGLLIFDRSSRSLTLTDGGRRDTAAVSALPQVLSVVRASPGTSKNVVEKTLVDVHGIAQKDARRAMARAVADGLVAVTEGPRRAQLLTLLPVADPLAAPVNLTVKEAG